VTNHDRLSDDDTKRALRVWDDYQKTHDVSALQGKAVGIDPKSERVWFGDDAREVARNARADGVTSRLLGLRVGQGFYLRKGGSLR
jgi:hypothetical protein